MDRVAEGAERQEELRGVGVVGASGEELVGMALSVKDLFGAGRE